MSGGGGGRRRGGGGVGARISEFVLLRNQIKNIFFFQCGGRGGGAGVSEFFEL